DSGRVECKVADVVVSRLHELPPESDQRTSKEKGRRGALATTPPCSRALRASLGRVAPHHRGVPLLAVRLPAARHLPALDLDADLDDAALENLAVDVDLLRNEERRRVERLL